MFHMFYYHRHQPFDFAATVVVFHLPRPELKFKPGKLSHQLQTAELTEPKESLCMVSLFSEGNV